MTAWLQDLRPVLDGTMAVCAAIYVLGVAWFVSGMRHREGRNREFPLVSIVIAARNEATRLGACLERLQAQDYPEELFEIIVVDDGSADQTARIAERAAGSFPRVRLLSTQQALGWSGSKKAALGLGIQAARGELVLTTDADCLVPPTWVRGMVAYFDEGTGLVAGFSQIGPAGAIRSARMGYEALDFLCLMSCILGSAGHGHPMAASGQNLAYRKIAFRQVGGYARVQHRASGDDVLLLQLVKRFTRWHTTFATAPETFAIHPPARSWSGFVQQRTRWASNAPYQLRFDPLFFVYMLVTFALSLLLLLSPLLALNGALSGGWAGGCWGAKVAAEWSICRKGTAFFARRDLRRYFPLWILLQPLLVVLIGGLGCLGMFSWKGKRHRWGRQIPEREGRA
jgi:cellulose synthase/poly-beta-1,6-N-acetylglucosamine synthase-like glycosyltransferase